MQCVATAMPTLAVSTIYCLWFAYLQFALRRRRQRERVAFLLWAAATGVPDHAPFDA
jgi:hypothetical protein